MNLRKTVALVWGVLVGWVHADQRFFTYTYEPKTLPKGAAELEQWATLRNGRDKGLYTRWDLRTEYEIGLTDRLTTAIYFNASNVYRHVDPTVPATNGLYFRGWSLEGKYQLLHPSADPLGVVLYGEVALDRREWEAEGKLILGKNVGRSIFAANGVFEQEWKATLDPNGSATTETEQKWEITGAWAYRWGNYALGGEVRSHSVRAEGTTKSAFFVGPAVHASGQRGWATLTLLKQLTKEFSEHEKTEMRLIVGIHL